jgi:hypothetical protein
MLLFFNIRPAMVSKHSKLAKRQTRDRYERFASLSSRTAPPPSCQEVGSSSRLLPPRARRRLHRMRRPARRWRSTKAPRMSRLGGSSPSRVVHGLSLLQPASRYLLLNDFGTINICWIYVILRRLNN